MPIRLVMLSIVVLALGGGVIPAQEESSAGAAAEPAETNDREEVVEAQVQQYVQMLQPLMWRELEFIRKTCDLKPEQRAKIKSVADASVKRAAADMIRPRQGGPRDASAVRKEIEKALKEVLPETQLSEYVKESEQRKAAHKHAAIRCVVSQLDVLLYLNKQQRDEISKSLETNWKDEWEQWVMILQYGGLYFPMVPDQHLTPHLNDEQKEVWKGAQKIGIGYWGGGLGQEAHDDDWWKGPADAEGAKTKPVEVKPE